MMRREREYHYAASDLIAKYVTVADEYFLSEYVEELITTKSWWDTVDGFGTTAEPAVLALRRDRARPSLVRVRQHVAQSSRHRTPTRVEERH